MIERATFTELLDALCEAGADPDKLKPCLSVGDNGAVIVTIAKSRYPAERHLLDVRPLTVGRIQTAFPSTEEAAEHVRQALYPREN